VIVTGNDRNYFGTSNTRNDSLMIETENHRTLQITRQQNYGTSKLDYRSLLWTS